MSSSQSKDASWLIGLLFIIPALVYLSFWHFNNWDFIQRAKPATATIVEIKRRVDHRSRHGRQYVTWLTYVEFKDAQGNTLEGTIYGRPGRRDIGSSVEVLHDPSQPDVRIAGGDGVMAGLYNSLIIIWFGLVLSLVAWLHTRRQKL